MQGRGNPPTFSFCSSCGFQWKESGRLPGGGRSIPQPRQPIMKPALCIQKTQRTRAASHLVSMQPELRSWQPGGALKNRDLVGLGPGAPGTPRFPPAHWLPYPSSQAGPVCTGPHGPAELGFMHQHSERLTGPRLPGGLLSCPGPASPGAQAQGSGRGLRIGTAHVGWTVRTGGDPRGQGAGPPRPRELNSCSHIRPVEPLSFLHHSHGLTGPVLSGSDPAKKSTTLESGAQGRVRPGLPGQ